MQAITMTTPHGLQEMTPAETAHKHHKSKPTTHTHTEPDGTRVVKTKQRKSLPDGITLTKVRTEKFSPPSDSKDAPITHIIKTKTKRIDSGGGLSTTTTTKEEMQECPPVTYTKVLKDGSRVIQTKKVTAAPVKTTTTIHLTNMPEHLSNVPTGLQEVDETLLADEDKKWQERAKEIDKMTPELLEDEEAPVPPHFIGVSYESGPPDVHKSLQVEEIHRNSEPQQQEEDSVVTASNKSIHSRFPFGRLFRSSKNTVAPVPMGRDSNVSSRRANGDPATNQDDEEGLAVAMPIDQEPIYEAEKFHPDARTPFYKQKRYIISTVLALVMISVIVAVSVVYATKEVTSDEPIKSELSERDKSIMEYIQVHVLAPNLTWKNISRAEPRGKALNWIVREDGLQLENLNQRLVQRYILALLAFSFDSKSWKYCGGEEDATSVCQVIDEETGELTDHIAWLSNKDECKWWGVACKRNRVVGLDLNDNSLIGEIPAEIAELDLELLSLSNNCLVGTLPPEIGTMKSLQQLDLELNGLSGTVPDLTTLAKLEKLNLADQYWSGVICTRSDGTVVDTSVEHRGLQGNILGPDIGQLKSLRDLSLYGNSFSGSIATEIGELENLVILNVGNNFFNGTIPQEITSLTNLRELIMESTYISGEIPPDIGNLKQLESLGLYTTYLEGTIPDSVYDLTNLQALLLYDNTPGFHGTIKTNIGDLTKLTHLMISDNPLLTGTLPTELGLCEELMNLQMSNTNISGTVPPELCDRSKGSLYSEYNGEFFKADCSPDNTTGTPFFSCDCCNTCCDHYTQVCLIKT